MEGENRREWLSPKAKAERLLAEAGAPHLTPSIAVSPDELLKGLWGGILRNVGWAV